ncbi:hypothetical protein FHX57_006747 [Paraburkholderia tropica]|uniref:hypothetical protein n=1 Tax=Paraburkholderia tropica TaxID=92647 RepID=UPI00160B7941|nr:hypothetical protein [Paraburkholderia tropica]MBB3004365.1 hypothetical protein [Paraburkholderia tropica]
MTADNFRAIIDAINNLTKKDVLVGIPDSAPERDDCPLTNAQIGYVMETGSPAHNVPARPFLIPGVSDVQSECADRLGKAADAALSGNQNAAERSMSAAGMIAESSVKKKIGSNIPPALSPDTIRNRRRSRQTQSMRPEEKQYLKSVVEGTDPAQAQTEAGIIPLVNTGQLRNSVTHVIREKK